MNPAFEIPPLPVPGRWIVRIIWPDKMSYVHMMHRLDTNPVPHKMAIAYANSLTEDDDTLVTVVPI